MSVALSCVVAQRTPKLADGIGKCLRCYGGTIPTNVKQLVPELAAQQQIVLEIDTERANGVHAIASPSDDRCHFRTFPVVLSRGHSNPDHS